MYASAACSAFVSLIRGFEMNVEGGKTHRQKEVACNESLLSCSCDGLPQILRRRKQDSSRFDIIWQVHSSLRFMRRAVGLSLFA